MAVTHFVRGPFGKSGRRGSNSRHSAWEADTLPTELRPQKNDHLFIKM